MRLFRSALNLALALCAAPAALVLAKPDAAEAAARAAAPVLPLRPIGQYSPAFAEADKIVGGQLADANDSKWVVALVTNSRVSRYGLLWPHRTPNRVRIAVWAKGGAVRNRQCHRYITHVPRTSDSHHTTPSPITHKPP